MANASKPMGLATGLALVDTLMRAAFETSRDPRSEAYKLGAREFLNFRALGRKLVLPYKMGTPEADAYWAGSDEGRVIWQRHLDASAVRDSKAASEAN